MSARPCIGALPTWDRERFNDVLRVRIGDRVRTLREQRNVSQYELARRTGSFSQVIRRVEYGVSVPDLITLARIALALDVQVTAITHVVDSVIRDVR